MVLMESLSFGFYQNGVHFCSGHPVFFSLDRLGLYAIYVIMFMEENGSSAVPPYRIAIHVLLIPQIYI